MRSIKEFGKPASFEEIKERKEINVSPLEIARDQTIQLYYWLYPYIASEFKHREDIQQWATQILKEFKQEVAKFNQQLNNLVAIFNSHIHPTSQGPTSPTTSQMTAPQLNTWKAQPEDFYFGDDLITDSSKYTSAIKHRDPEEKPSSYKPSIDVVKELKKIKKFIPFDIQTGEGDYVQDES